MYYPDSQQVYLFLSSPGQKLNDGKGIQGRGRLTQEQIDSFQVFYGKALCNNKGDVDAMSRSTMAILKHYSEMPEEDQHADCPKGLESWCRYQVDTARGDDVTTYVPVKNPISPALHEVLLPTFKALGDKKLLQACQQCKDQNANESLHSVIWNVVPKDQYHSPQEVSLGINIAVGLFNDGQRATLSPLMENMGISTSPSSTDMWLDMDTKRVKQSEKRHTEEYKTVRREKRKGKLRKLDAFSHIEGETYKSGAFHSNIQSAKPRRAPKCSKCGKPTKGHKKGVCSSSPTVGTEVPPTEAASTPKAVSPPHTTVPTLEPMTAAPRPSPPMIIQQADHNEGCPDQVNTVTEKVM
jgi:hypothetical protein